MGHRTRDGVDDNQVNAEAYQLLTNGNWVNKNGVSTLTINQEDISQPRILVAGKIEEMLMDFDREAGAWHKKMPDDTVTVSAQKEPLHAAIAAAKSAGSYEAFVELAQEAGRESDMHGMRTDAAHESKRARRRPAQFRHYGDPDDPNKGFGGKRGNTYTGMSGSDDGWNR